MSFFVLSESGYLPPWCTALNLGSVGLMFHDPALSGLSGILKTVYYYYYHNFFYQIDTRAAPRVIHVCAAETAAHFVRRARAVQPRIFQILKPRFSNFGLFLFSIL